MSPNLPTQNRMFTVTSADREYNSPMIGNGEVVTTVGPTGYHNGYCPPEERVNRTLFWAGRRLRDARSAMVRIPRVPPEELIGPTLPLIRFGRLHRTFRIDGAESRDDKWEQSADFDRGRIVSVLRHGGIIETTESIVCLTENVLVFRTRLENARTEPSHVEFIVDYEFGDAEGGRPSGTRLHIRRPHPDDLGFANVEGTRALEGDLEHRPPHLLESLSVQYEIESHLGEVHLGRYPIGEIRATEAGGRFIHGIELASSASAELWFWISLSDRTKYRHFPQFERIGELLEGHERGWGEFWAASSVEIGDPKLDAVRKACLYTLRCYSSPWSLPPGYLSTHWEGRTFHDEFFPFMGLLSSNHAERAKRIPDSRLLTLPLALQRAAGAGAHFGWEVTETGEESAPYGHWVDEQFVHGQISEQAWRYYLATRDHEDLERFYPMIKGCAEWLRGDMLVRDASGRLSIREASDVSEHVISARNSIYTASSVVRSLENASRASELLKKDAVSRRRWKLLAAELRASLPLDAETGGYRYADDRMVPTETAHLGMVFPFSFEVFGQRSRRTLESALAVFRSTWGKKTSDQVFSYNWIWAIGRLAVACFYQGRGDDGYEVLGRAQASVGPFMAPCEHYREKGGAFLPWFGTGAGAYVYAMNAMFVQVFDEDGAILLPAVPSAPREARFHDLLATHGVRISGSISKGKVDSLSAHSEKSLRWGFRVPAAAARSLRFSSAVSRKGTDPHGFLRFVCQLKRGTTRLASGR